MRILIICSYQYKYVSNVTICISKVYYFYVLYRWFGLDYLFNGISIPYGLFDAKIYLF